MKKGRMGMIIYLAILIVLQFVGSQVLAQTSKGVMKVAFHHNVAADWLDPSINLGGTSNCFPLYFFHDSLVKPMPGVLYAPCLAESWTTSPDQRVYEFKLRRGVTFHNGDAMTAEDVVFTFKRYKGGAAKIIQDKIEKLEAVNHYLFRVTFKKPFPDFLEYFLPGLGTLGWIVPKKYIEKVGDAEYKRHPIGCGPYKFVESTTGVRLVGEAFEGYWRKVPKVKRVEYYSVVEMSTRYAMITRGEVDLALYFTDVFYERVRKELALRLLTMHSSNYWFIYMTSQWNPKSPWSDPRVRKAASLAIDRKTLAEVSFPEGAPLETIGLPGDPESVRFPAEPYDPERAKRLLAEAGYSNGFHGGKFFPFGGPHAPMGEQIVTYWKAVGIKVDSILLDSGSWTAQRRGGQMKGGIFNDPIGAPTMGSRLSYLLGPQGYGNYPEIQTLWDQYKEAVDPNTRKDLIARVQNFIVDKTMVIPLISGGAPAAAGPRVKGNPLIMREPFPIWFPCPMEDFELNE